MPVNTIPNTTKRSPTVFLIDCYEFQRESSLSSVPIEVKKKPGFSAVYHRGIIDSCLEGITEYERLARDIRLTAINISVICTGRQPHLYQTDDHDDDQLDYCPDLTQHRWQQSLQLACHHLHDGDRMIIVLRYQQGLHDTDVQLDDVEGPISITESMQKALLAIGRERSVKLTIIRVAKDPICEDSIPFSSMSVAITSYSLLEAFPIAIETFIVPLSNIFSAFWELAQRHLDLRSINISGIPMKKSRKQANLGKKFSVAFLYPNSEHSERDRIQDQNEIAQGLIRIGSSSWLTRRSKDVFWSHAPDDFDISRVLFSSIHIVTPSNLSSPLTAPLLKAVLAPSGFLFFSDKESEPPSLIMALHHNRLYIHEIASISENNSEMNEPMISDDMQAFVEQFELVAQMMTLRSSGLRDSVSEQQLACHIGSILSAKQIALCSSWKNCRLHTIASSCIRTMLKANLLQSEIQDLSIAIEALRTASLSEDATFLPSSAQSTDVAGMYESMWRRLSIIAAIIQSWSDVHGLAANMINAASPGTRIHSTSMPVAKTLMDAFWNSELQRISPALAAAGRL